MLGSAWRRRSDCATLATLATLAALLLLLARLPPPAPHAALLAPARAPTSTWPTATKHREPRVVLVRDVYLGGHLRPHPELCPALGARLRLLVLVTSAPGHAAARKAVRLTWGQHAARADVAVAFVLGALPPAFAVAIEAEDTLYGDVIVGRWVDSYKNLTLKTLSMLEWADTYCPRAPRLLKTDDDVFINIPRLLQFTAAPARANATRTIWGKVFRRMKPNRTASSRYYVSPLQFPGHVFPKYTSGPAYLLTADCVRALLAAAPRARYVSSEDAFVTGVLAARLGLGWVGPRARARVCNESDCAPVRLAARPRHPQGRPPQAVRPVAHAAEQHDQVRQLPPD